MLILILRYKTSDPKLDQAGIENGWTYQTEEDQHHIKTHSKLTS